MELLARTIRSFRHVVGNNRSASVLLGAVAFLVVVEFGGPLALSADWQDFFAVAGLGVVLTLLAQQHIRSPLPWLQPVSQAARAAGSWLKHWFVELGYDLRGEPPVKRGLPPLVFGLAAAFLGWGTVLLAFGDFFPGVLRQAGVRFFYTGYLSVMAFIWFGLFLSIGVASYFAVGFIHDDLAADSDGQTPRAPSRAALFLGLASLLLLGGRFVPLWQALTASVVAWALATAISMSSGADEVRFLWRPRGSVRVRSISAAHAEIAMIGLATLLTLDLIVTAAGSQVWAPAVSGAAMPLTVFLGTALGWVLTALLWIIVWQKLKESFYAPSRPARRVLHARGAAGPEQQRGVRRRFPRRQWRIQFAPAIPDPCAVQIELVAHQSQAHEFDPDWPLKVNIDDLADPKVRSRIERRSDIQIRRRIVLGLERLFKVAKRRKYRNGHGFWVAPHLGLWNGLRRDEPEPEPGPFDTHMVHDNIGPAYHRVFPRLARHLMHRMMRDLRLDLIFVEDGVTFRRFARVVRRLFDLHDRQPGRPAEDQHFVGLPGARVMVYEFQFDNPFESDVYPEPKFTALGRARILLVFRDRSEHEELVEPPFDASRTPVTSRQ